MTLEKLNTGLLPFSKDSGKASHTPVDATRTGSKKTKWSWPFSKEQTEEMITKLQRSKADVTVALSTDEWRVAYGPASSLRFPANDIDRIKARTSLNHQKQITNDLNNLRTLVARNLSLVEAENSGKRVNKAQRATNSHSQTHKDTLELALNL
jgi:hypothetical protein